MIFSATTTDFRSRTLKFYVTKLLTIVTSHWFWYEFMYFKFSSKGMNKRWQVHSLWKCNKGCFASFRISNPFKLNSSNGLGQLFQIFIIFLNPINYTFYLKFEFLIVSSILMRLLCKLV